MKAEWKNELKNVFDWTKLFWVIFGNKAYCFGIVAFVLPMANRFWARYTNYSDGSSLGGGNGADCILVYHFHLVNNIMLDVYKRQLLHLPA